MHTNVCSGYIPEALHWVWVLSKYDNKNTRTMSTCRFMILVNFGQDFPFFMVLLLLTLNILCLVWMSLNATLLQRGYDIGVISMGIVAKIILLQFQLGKLAQCHSWDLAIVIFTYCFISLLTWSKFPQCFKVLLFTIETVFLLTL